MLSTSTLVLSSGCVYSGSSLFPTRILNPNFPFDGILVIFLVHLTALFLHKRMIDFADSMYQLIRKAKINNSSTYDVIR